MPWQDIEKTIEKKTIMKMTKHHNKMIKTKIKMKTGKLTHDITKWNYSSYINNTKMTLDSMWHFYEEMSRGQEVKVHIAASLFEWLILYIGRLRALLHCRLAHHNGHAWFILVNNHIHILISALKIIIFLPGLICV